MFLSFSWFTKLSGVSWVRSALWGLWQGKAGEHACTDKEGLLWTGRQVVKSFWNADWLRIWFRNGMPRRWTNRICLIRQSIQYDRTGPVSALKNHSTLWTCEQNSESIYKKLAKRSTEKKPARKTIPALGHSMVFPCFVLFCVIHIPSPPLGRPGPVWCDMWESQSNRSRVGFLGWSRTEGLLKHLQTPRATLSWIPLVRGFLNLKNWWQLFFSNHLVQTKWFFSTRADETLVISTHFPNTAPRRPHVGGPRLGGGALGASLSLRGRHANREDAWANVGGWCVLLFYFWFWFWGCFFLLLFSSCPFCLSVCVLDVHRSPGYWVDSAFPGT